MTGQDLPHPDSEELEAIVKGRAERAVYGYLYENRDRWVSMREIEDGIESAVGRQTQMGRRRRIVAEDFVIGKQRFGRETKYQLVSRRERSRERSGISEKTRAEVLRWGRCAMCGKRALEDDVRLQVDHRIPQALGGTDEIENLQPLCEQCNRGKKDLFVSYGPYAEQITAAIALEEPHKRIGELLKAFNGEWVRGDVIELVANAQQYQDDWKKRMRELRVLDWDYEYRKQREDGRFRTYFRLLRSEPWPEGPVRAEISRREELKRASKKALRGEAQAST